MSKTITGALAALALASCLNPRSRLGGDGGTADAGTADAGTGDACPALSCGDAQACLRGACEDRVTQFPTLPNIYHGVDQVIAGPGGLVWFVSVSRQNIGNITTEGVVTEYHAPDGTSPYFIAAGPDGNIWYADVFSNTVGRMTPSGIYSKPFSLSVSEIVSGSDGNLWMSTNGPNILRMTTAGDVTTFPLPTPDAGAFGLISGPDGNVWFGESSPQVGTLPQVGRITPEGVISELPLGSGVSPRTLASGGDGNIWLTVSAAGPVTTRQIQRMTPQGEVTVFLFPVPVEVPRALTYGPDGNIWFAEDEWDRAGIGRLTPTGEVIELLFPSPAGQSVYGLNTIVAGADGNIWFSLLYQDNIGRVIPF